MDHLERLMAERACERLVARYTHLIDLGEGGRVGELFTADGLWESAEARMEGRDQITAGFGRRQANAERRSRHVCTNVVVDVDEGGETATGVTYFVLFREDGVAPDRTAPLPGPQIVGEYHDRFVRDPGGWRIAQRQAAAAFVRRADR